MPLNNRSAISRAVRADRRLVASGHLGEDTDGRLRHFGVGDDRIDRSGLIRHGVVGPRLRRLRGRNRAKAGSYLRFDRGFVEIADGDDRHHVGAVPVGVELLQPIVIRVADDLRPPDGRPFSVARALQQHGHLRVPYPLAGSEPQPPLFENDAPLLVDLDRVERHVAREVFEDGERPIHDRRIAGRDLQLVHRLVEAGVRVHMRAEPHAERLHEARDLLLRKMLRAVEGHVLDEMRQPPLVFVFEHRTCLHHEPKLGARLRQPVLANVVAQAVRQRANRDQRIDRNGLVERRVLRLMVAAGCWAPAKLTTDVTARIGSSRRKRV